jgi:hypothetical protein
MKQVAAMHPRDFTVNQTWLAYRVNQRPIQVGEGALDLFVLQDAASMFVFGNGFSLHEAESPGSDTIEDLFQKAFAKGHTWPQELVLVGKPSRGNTFAASARAKGINVRSVPEAQMSLYIKDLQESLEEFMGRDAEGDA